MIFFALLLASAGLLTAGVLRDDLLYTYGSAGLALFALVLVTGAIARHRRSAKAEPSANDDNDPGIEDLSTLGEGSVTDSDELLSSDEITRADDVVVFSIPGRKRFHRAGCRHLRSRRCNELTLEEALDEGFSACTNCSGNAAQRSYATKATSGASV